MESVTKAVQAARYNEAVVVCVGGDQELAKQELVLVATLDLENGGVVWQSASTDGEVDVGITRHLRTKRWVLPMLNDKIRNIMYQDAIQKACMELADRMMKVKDKSDKSASLGRILDIGSGTGLLAMMGAKYAHEALRPIPMSAKVVSLEMASAMARLAKQTIASNHFEGSTIEILEQHSCEMSSDERFMLCTSELLESSLLGEGIIPALRDAWERHLHPDAIVVPQKARVYAQLLESEELILPYAGPKVNGTMETPLRLSTSSDNDSGSIMGDSVSGLTVPLHAKYLLDDMSKTKVLTDPMMLVDFDFTSRDTIPGPEGRSCSKTVVAKESGTVHGVLFWWELDLWDGVTYSTECGKQDWQDHWQQCLYVFTSPTLSRLEEGQEIDLKCHHSDTKLAFSLHSTDGHHAETKRAKLVLENPQLSPLRAAVLADTARLLAFQKAILSTLAVIGHDALVLDLSDFSLCAILAALDGCQNVLSVESSSGELPMLSARIAQIGNQLPRDGSNFSILQCHDEELTLDALGGMPGRIVVAEPFYEMLEGWHLQEAINYFCRLRSLTKRALLAEEYISIPSCARIMCCAIQSTDLFRAYRACGDDDNLLCDFDHSLVNTFAARCHEYDISIPIWQYQHTPLSLPFELARLNYNTSTIQDDKDWKHADSQRSGICHAILVWVEYDVDNLLLFSTRSRPYNQVVRLLETPGDFNSSSKLKCRLSIGGNDQCNNEVHKIEIHIS